MERDDESAGCTMGEMTLTATIDIDAPSETVYAVLTGYELIPDWDQFVVRTRVLARDEQGRGTRVEFEANLKVTTVRYVTEFTYDEPHMIGASTTFETHSELGSDARRSETSILGVKPSRVLRTVLGVIDRDLRTSESVYELEEIGVARTSVRWRVAVDPGVFVPSPIKRMVTGQVLEASLNALKRRVESVEVEIGA